jgi:DNA-binding MarR family transcriptional regulator
VSETPSPPDDLGAELLRAAAMLTRWASRHASLDLPLAQARLLALVQELGPVRIGELAAADHCSQPTMSTQVQRLETEGWLHRSVDPEDSRASLISLTSSGQRSLDRARAARRKVVEPLLQTLDATDRARLRDAVDVIEGILASAREVSPAAIPLREG